jgi:hypothetical protein
LEVAVIVAVGTTATVTASKATSAIPIVMVAGVGGNSTGVTTIVQEASGGRHLFLEGAGGSRSTDRPQGILLRADRVID